ncbi:hypothetical protein RI129_005090 [Pyrocoelia pectoralis]|uniref:Uncharacterized protein n=1 Tax=Pyrocoelia pectoralis TaxID=417401 RepID=A0AAN7ZRX6_9COLE
MDGDELRWRPPVILLIPILLCCIFIFYVDVFQLTTLNISSTFKLPPPRFLGYVEDNNLNDYLIKTEGCRIPYMDPLDPSIVEFITNEKQVLCNKNKPPLFKSNLTSLHVIDSSLKYYKIHNESALECCYTVFKRVVPNFKENDNKVEYGECLPFYRDVNIDDEFVKVSCTYKSKQIYTDFFSFVPIKPTLTTQYSDSTSLLNVLVIGLDAVSRVNLHRQMPKTVQVLKEMEAVEFLGYNKVADNTFPNLIPILTGLSENELAETCWRSINDRFDNCSFIWKNFSRKNYATAFGEDSAWMGMFNYAKFGFTVQPTDYFWDPFNYRSEKEIGNQHKMNVYQCVGSREVYKVLLEYIEKFVLRMRQSNIPFFGFFWGSSLSHDYLNKPKLGDEHYANFFGDLVRNGILKNTVLLFISDHGIRWGGIRATFQGRMEERLPFLFMVLPSEYRENHHLAYSNLKRNARRLITPFDLHETIKDLLNPYALTQNFINSRAENRDGDVRGYSLFELIPSNRTCLSANIASHWCTCQESTKIDNNSNIAVETGAFAIDYLNNKLSGYAECAKLALANVHNIHEHSTKEQFIHGKSYYLDYTIVFETVPGNGIFEATIRKHVKNGENTSYFNVTGTISRINLYGSQSLCMTEFHIKLYCYCV